MPTSYHRKWALQLQVFTESRQSDLVCFPSPLAGLPVHDWGQFQAGPSPGKHSRLHTVFLQILVIFTKWALPRRHSSDLSPNCCFQVQSSRTWPGGDSSVFALDLINLGFYYAYLLSQKVGASTSSFY